MTKKNEQEELNELLREQRDLLKEILELEQQIKLAKSNPADGINPIMYWQV